MSFHVAVTDENCAADGERDAGDDGDDFGRRETGLRRRRTSSHDNRTAARGGRPGAGRHGGLRFGLRRNRWGNHIHVLQSLNDRVVAGHHRSAVSHPVGAAVPGFDAADEIPGIGEPVHVLPAPEGRADFRLHIEARGDGGIHHHRQAG